MPENPSAFSIQDKSSYVYIIWIFALGLFLFLVSHKLIDYYYIAKYDDAFHMDTYNITYSIYNHVKSYF